MSSCGGSWQHPESGDKDFPPSPFVLLEAVLPGRGGLGSVSNTRGRQGQGDTAWSVEEIGA